MATKTLCAGSVLGLFIFCAEFLSASCAGARLAGDRELSSIVGGEDYSYCETHSSGCPTCGYEGEGHFRACDGLFYNQSCQPGFTYACVTGDPALLDCGNGVRCYEDDTCNAANCKALNGYCRTVYQCLTTGTPVSTAP
jgi:hypothetical protein